MEQIVGSKLCLDNTTTFDIEMSQKQRDVDDTVKDLLSMRIKLRPFTPEIETITATLIERYYLLSKVRQLNGKF